MESANLHHKHQLQEQLIGSSSLANPSFYGVGNTHTWTPNLILNASISNPNVNGVFSNSRDLRQNNYIHVPPSLNTSMIQDLGYHWASNVGSFSNHSANELQLIAKIKEENSDSFPKFSEMINSPSNVEEFHLPSTSYIKHEQQDLHDLSEKLLLKTISSGCQISGLQLSSGGLYSNSPISYASFGGVATPSRGNFSQIFPSIHISNPNASSSSFSSSLGMNLQALDLLNSTKFGGSFSHPSNNDLGLFKESPSFSLDHLQESSTRPSNSQNKMSSFTNGVTETKRPSSISEPKASHGAPKKPRLESRSPFPPFKVRKEKLGDRIVALQQLVAPFGKTDTASVLMEAIGYIKFLQDQVETLSVPYMKSARNCSRQMQGGSIEDNRDEEPKPDLRSRGLCLVPISCTSYVTNDNGGVWPHPNFG